MQKVITINLNGVAYQIDESGYTALVAYLGGAERQLKDNPDRAEIIADLEQAIADKCRGFLNPNKTVVSAAEVDQIIREMGPVEAGEGAPHSGSSQTAGAGQQTSGRTGPKRLYRIEEDAVWMGVCAGMAAYVGIDPVFVRILFLLLIFWTGGLALIGYWILGTIIPEASTTDERAAAHGQPPLNAQDLIDRARTQYSHFKNDRDWRRRWRRERQEWRRRWRGMHVGRWGSAWTAPPPGSPAVAYGSYGDYGTRMMSGLLVPILSIASVLLFWFWAWAVYSLVTTGQVLGQALPEDVPFWIGILVLVCLYQAVSWPLHFARRRAAIYSFAGSYHGVMSAWDGMLQLGLSLLVLWLAYRYLPEIREVLRSLPDVWNSLVSSINS